MFTSAQYKEFPILWEHGTPIWILVSADLDGYKKLFEHPNLYEFMEVKGKYYEDKHFWRKVI